MNEANAIANANYCDYWFSMSILNVYFCKNHLVKFLLKDNYSTHIWTNCPRFCSAIIELPEWQSFPKSCNHKKFVAPSEITRQKRDNTLRLPDSKISCNEVILTFLFFVGLAFRCSLSLRSDRPETTQGYVIITETNICIKMQK